MKSKPLHEFIIDALIQYGLAEKHQINESAFKDECDRWASSFKDYSFVAPSSVIDDASQEYLKK